MPTIAPADAPIITQHPPLTIPLPYDTPSLQNKTPAKPVSPYTPQLITTDDDHDNPVVHMSISKPHDFDLASNMFGPSVNITIPIKCTNPTLGFNLQQDTDNKNNVLKTCRNYTPATCIPRWRSTLQDSIFLATNGKP